MSATKTTQSFKSHNRDKPKHSANEGMKTKKGGAGGKGTWGSAQDDYKFKDSDSHALNDQDPNYDPNDETEGGYMLAKIFVPSTNTDVAFRATLNDLRGFKKSIRDATEEYLLVGDVDEFEQCVKDLNLSIYHQNIPAIIIKLALDKNDEEKMKVSQLLRLIHKKDIVTLLQMGYGFRKLFSSLDDLVIDAPNAKVVLREFLGHANAAGYIDAKEAAGIEQEMQDMADDESVKDTKDQINKILREFLLSNVTDDLKEYVHTLKPALVYEVTKQMILLGMDRSPRDREVVSSTIAELSSGLLPITSISKAFEVLLSRVEDIVLDVPDVLAYLSSFIARAVVDEVLPPVFLVNLDLSPVDLGFKVVERAQEILARPRVAAELASVWVEKEDAE